MSEERKTAVIETTDSKEDHDLLIDVCEDDLRMMDSVVFSWLLCDCSLTAFDNPNKMSGIRRHNIIWATDGYVAEHGESYAPERQIVDEQITGDNRNVIKPRVLKAKEEQKARTKGRAEVFTPSWVCNIQNNLFDESFFGREHVFNVPSEDNRSWESTKGKISFKDAPGGDWKKYVCLNILEITCGEAPYLVSRYDTTTGDFIEIPDRIGMLDRKLRIINENVEDELEWMIWTIKAYQSTYGFEFQGDNLLLARENMLRTFTDYLEDKWQRTARPDELRAIARIIAWNIWQMDGIAKKENKQERYLVPYSEYEDRQQLVNAPQEESLFDDELFEEPDLDTSQEEDKIYVGAPAKIMWWDKNKSGAKWNNVKTKDYPVIKPQEIIGITKEFSEFVSNDSSR